MDPRQIPQSLEILDDIVMVFGVADGGDTEEPDQLLFRHDSWTGQDFTIRAWQNGGQVMLLLSDSHGCSLCFLRGIDRKRGGPKEKNIGIWQFLLLDTPLKDSCNLLLFLRE
jgi:hypothetical protein